MPAAVRACPAAPCPARREAAATVASQDAAHLHGRVVQRRVPVDGEVELRVRLDAGRGHAGCSTWRGGRVRHHAGTRGTRGNSAESRYDEPQHVPDNLNAYTSYIRVGISKHEYATRNNTTAR